jgi:AraC-like DNA-binding protein
MLMDEHHSDLGEWSTAARRAPPAMRAFVGDIFGSRSTLPNPLREHHIPSLSVALVINFGAPHRLIERAGPGGPDGAKDGVSAWVTGLQSGPWLSEAVGEREFMAVRLTLIGAHRILRLRMDLIADRVVELEEIDLRFARALVGRVRRARDWAGRFDALEAVLTERLADREPSALPARALGRLLGAGGDLSLASLAAELGCSHRHLIAKFHEQVGLPPKRIARLIRMNRALAAINQDLGAGYSVGKPYLEREPDPGAARDSRIDWADLAASVGYYDQPHFIREFQAFTGWSPTRFRAAFHPDAAG